MQHGLRKQPNREVLGTRYPGSTHVYLENLSTAVDEKIWEFARSNGFAIVTKDADFHEFSLIYGPPPKIIWLKCGNQSNQFIKDLLLTKADVIGEFLHDNSAACLEIFS